MKSFKHSNSITLSNKLAGLAYDGVACILKIDNSIYWWPFGRTPRQVATRQYSTENRLKWENVKQECSLNLLAKWRKFKNS